MNWTCPYCNKDQVVTPPKYDTGRLYIDISGSWDGPVGITHTSIGCSNKDCLRLSLRIAYVKYSVTTSGSPSPPTTEITAWQLLPQSSAKPQPDYIPAVIRQDYYEACLIKTGSPKASATLSRRCLQGMIRDFCGISKARLIDEVRALRAAVDEGSAPRAVTIESVDAIDHVRAIGNIGAHMERDIDVIVEVDPDEAGVLIELIEMLFREWYVEQHNREQRLMRITALGATKQQQIADARAGVQALPAPEDSQS